MRRVVVLGSSGSGKTTLARELARRMNVPHIELDAIYWQPNWTGLAKPIFRQRVAEAVAQEAWALCGSYAPVRDLTLARADTVIWLDYPLRVVFMRVLRRTIRRSFSGEELWSGNRESLGITFCSRRSLLLWVINTWRIRRRDYPKMLRSESCCHLRVLRFRSPAETAAWLARTDAETSESRGLLSPLPQNARADGGAGHAGTSWSSARRTASILSSRSGNEST